MPRPPDTYTHSQFETVDSTHEGETVQCVHCRTWTGSIKTLNRKKEHLMKCPAYARWRAEGHGRDLLPPNRYNKRASGVAFADESDQYSSPYNPGPYFNAAATRTRHPDLGQLFDEFPDEDNNQKCMRVRCKHCGFVRAKNTTRQVEHLVQCKEYLKSTDGQRAVASGELQLVPPSPSEQPAAARADVWQGKAPNPALQVRRQDSRQNLNKTTPTRPPPQRPTPSLVNHLLSRDHAAFQNATQRQFLSHAGCGTLSMGPLVQWLSQDGILSRAFVSFIGALIGKIRLPETKNSHMNTTYRAMDLLISALNNARREMTFFESTQQKYGLAVGGEDIKPATKAYLDLFNSASSPAASLLEGMVVLWATEHCYRTSWQYAGTFTSTMPASTYSLPSYLQPGGGSQDYVNPYAPAHPADSDNAHIAALHQALIPNWTSPAFEKFVDACRSIVDELANAQTSGNGKEEMMRCESTFHQVVWLWERIWPEVDGMGEENELADGNARGQNDPRTSSGPTTSTAPGTNGAAEPPTEQTDGVPGDADSQPIQLDDDTQDASGDAADSPYGGTGLGAVAAANQVS